MWEESVKGGKQNIESLQTGRSRLELREGTSVAAGLHAQPFARVIRQRPSTATVAQLPWLSSLPHVLGPWEPVRPICFRMRVMSAWVGRKGKFRIFGPGRELA